MPGIVDVAEIKKPVPIGAGVTVDTYGVSMAGIAMLFSRFPIMAKLFGGTDVVLTPAVLMEAGPDVAAAVIAAGCGQSGDTNAERMVSLYPLRAQMDLLESIIDLTIGVEGLGPFVERLNRVFSATNALTKSPDTSSPAQSSA